jgi:Protein of unknown function (DUF3352)
VIRGLAAGVAAAALVLGAAACGGDDEGEGAAVPPTASVAPADAPVFGDATVRPEGDQADAVDEALSKLLNTDDPGGFIADQIDNGLEEDEELGALTYSEDVEPWLGEHAGFFFTTFDDEPSGAFIVEVTDEAAATLAVDKIETRGPSAGDSYKGVEYRLEDRESAIGFIDDFLVFGTEGGFRDAVDASQGESLADDDGFTGEVETVPEDSLGIVYAAVPTLLDRLVDAGEIGSDERANLGDQLGDVVTQPAIAALSTDGDSIAVQVGAGAGDMPEPEESPLLRELPADSWLAFGLNDFGTTISDSFANLQFSGAGPEELDRALEPLLGSRLSDFTDWIGDVGGYASGTSIFGLGAALELETTDESASADALDGLQGTLGRFPSLRIEPLSGGEPGFTISPADAPVQIVVEQRQGRVVAGLGENSVDAVLEPDDALGESDPFGTAADALGSEYAASFFLDFEPVLELFESTGEDDDPEYQSAKPYLDHLDYLITGQRRDGDQNVMRAVLGLR